MILAITSNEAFNFNFHPIVWKSLLDNQISFKEYETIDINFYNLITELEKALIKKDEDLINSFDLNFVIKNSIGNDIELIDSGKETRVTLENIDTYIKLAKSMRMKEIKEQIKYIKNGLNSVIEENIIKILDWKQFEEMVCGEAKFDMESFKKYTKCDNKIKEIKWFWEWLENCKEEDKFKYLKFVSGRSRLPKSKIEHVIKLMSSKKNELPKSSTCFNTLYLPLYDSKEILCEKIKIAIDNITTINDTAI